MEMAITRKPRRGRKPGKRTNCLGREPSSSATASSLSAQATSSSAPAISSSAPAISSSAPAISSSAPSAKTTRQKRTPKETYLTTVPSAAPNTVTRLRSSQK